MSAGSSGGEAGKVAGSSDPGNSHDEESKGAYAAADAAADAFALGQHQLRLEYYAEALWCDPGGPDVEAFNNSPLTKDLLVAAEGLKRASQLLGSRLREESERSLVAEVANKATAFVDDLRQRWATSERREVCRAITEGTEPEGEYESWEIVLKSSPLQGDAKVALNEAINRLVSRLPSPHSNLRELGRLVTSVDYPTILGGFRAYPPEGEGVYFTNTLNGQIEALMTGLSEVWPGLATVDWDLSSCYPNAAREKLRRLQAEVPAAIAGLWVWAATPLAGGNVGNRTAPIQTSLRGQYWNDKSTDQRYYVPTTAELSQVAGFCEGGEAGDPSWPAVEAALVAAGDSREELAKLNAPALVGRLHEHRGSSPVGDVQRGRGDVASHEVPSENVFQLSGEYWDVSFQGKTAKLKNSVGLQRIAYLIARRDEQDSVQVMALIHLKGNTPGDYRFLDHTGADGTPDAGPGGSTRRKVPETAASAASDTRDDVLDAKTVTGFRRRLSQIGPEIDAARREGANARATELEDEQHQIEQQLKNTGGPAGRKKLGKDPIITTAENVLKGLRREYARMRPATKIPDLATHLERAIIKAGGTFAYRPETNTPSWKM